MRPAATAAIPALFISHGAGPAFLLDGQAGSIFATMDRKSEVARAWSEMREARGLPRRPKAIVVVSAHWEERTPHVTSGSSNKLLYDYYGFPDAAYQLSYPAPGDPELARRIVKLIDSKLGPGTTKADPTRGLDHGVFVPLLLLYPEADVPVVQLSLSDSLDPVHHYEIGRALAPLRADNVLVVGSGQATHPMATRDAPKAEVDAFMARISTLMRSDAHGDAKRDEIRALFRDPTFVRLLRATHNPRIEHIMPLFVAMGVADGAPVSSDLFPDTRMLGGAFSLASWSFGGDETGEDKSQPERARNEL